jgi:hypothetical protein
MYKGLITGEHHPMEGEAAKGESNNEEANLDNQRDNCPFTAFGFTVSPNEPAQSMPPARLTDTPRSKPTYTPWIAPTKPKSAKSSFLDTLPTLPPEALVTSAVRSLQDGVSKPTTEYT